MNSRGSIWYAIGVLIIIVGMTVSVLGAINDAKALQTEFTRFVAPGSKALQLAKPGPYVIYYEYRGAVNGQGVDTAETTDIQCSVTSRDGRGLEVAPATLNAEYDFGGRKAVAQFAVPQAGTYIISCQHPSGRGESIAMAVAPIVAVESIASLFKWLAVALGSIGLGLVVLIVTLVRRAPPTRPVPPLP